MLTRITGGNHGIKEYLENGQKEGRDFTRDQLDERVVLAGDLSLTDEVIQSIESEGDRYLHITLAFKEDHVPPDVLRQVVKDFERFAFSAFRPDEYNLYAEAHIPKIKSYVNRKTGDFVERKPHIHIVAPKKNLLSGAVLDPLYKPVFDKATGRLVVPESQFKWLDAFQEHINNKYGLASPKENRRVYFTGESEMISRYKGDMFNGQNSELREAVLADVIGREVTSYDEFERLVREYGKTRLVAGKGGEYINVKQAGKDKGVNLKDYVFSREFIELPQREKVRALEKEIQRKYEEAGSTKRDPAYIADTLREWHEVRAREIKYVNSGNRKFYQAYRAAERGEKLAILASREAAFYQKHDKELNNGQEPGDFERIRNNLRAADGHLQSARRAADRLDRGARNVADRAARRAVAAAVRGHAGDQARADHQARLGERKRPADNVTGQYQADAQEHHNAQRAEGLSEFQEIKRQLDARRLLAYLSKTHGVIPEKYEIHKGKDGGDRIRCGSRNLNVSDFLTAELKLSWKEAAPILRECYAAQLGLEPAHEIRREPKHSSLWQQYKEQYQAWKAGRMQRKDEAWDQQKVASVERRQTIRRTFQQEKARIYADAKMKPADRRAAISLARMDKVQAEKTLTEQSKVERAALKTAYTVKAADLFRVFLQERAQAGDEHALAELRRQRIEPIERNALAQQLTGGATSQADEDRRGKDPIQQGEKIAYRVALNGDVTYQIDGRDVLRDESRAVKVLESNDREVLETGLRLALQKFGPRIQARGDEEFQRRIVEVSVDAGLRVEFTDPLLNEYRQQLEIEKRATAEQAREAARPQPKPQERPAMDQPTVSRGHAATAEQRKQEEKRRYEEAVQRAKDADLPAWLLDRGIQIQKNGTNGWKYSHGNGEADRIFKSRHGNWMVHSSQGEREYMDAIAYAQMHTGLSHRQAVEALSGMQLSAVAAGQPAAVAAAAKQAREKGARPDPVATSINIREATKQQRVNAYSYALSRGISQETLKEAGEQGVIKADHRGLVFVGHDHEGKIRSAETRFIKAEQIGDETTTKMCYAGTDKTFPPILRGNDKDVHFVEGGFDALALHDLYKREGKEPPTTIITGGARTLKWQDNPEICNLIKNADHVRPWYDNELKADGQIDAKKQADTQEAHDKQRDTIIQIRGQVEGVEEMRPPAGVKDIADWNVQHAQEHQAEQKRHEEQDRSMRP